MTKTEAIEKAIARYVKHGGNEADGRALLEEEMHTNYSAQNLACALAYWNFATTHTAQRMAVALRP